MWPQLARRTVPFPPPRTYNRPELGSRELETRTMYYHRKFKQIHSPDQNTIGDAAVQTCFRAR